MIRDRVRWAEFSTGPARVAEFCDARVDRLVDVEGNRRGHTAHAKQRAQAWMNDRPVAAELPETRLQSNWDVQQVAVTNRMLDTTGVPQRADVSRELYDGLAESEVHAQALDGRLSGRHDLKLAPAHGLTHGDGECLGHGSPAVDVARFDFADADDVGAEPAGLLLQVTRRVAGRFEPVPNRRDLSVEPSRLIVVDFSEIRCDLLDVDRPAANGCVPLFPGEGGRSKRRGVHRSVRGPSTPSTDSNAEYPCVATW